MPIKNTGSYLKPCLESIINQSLKNWELIAVDDHSDDGSYDLLEKYALNDERIKAFKNEESGIIGALRTGLNNCSGQYITRMDSDDLMTSDKLEKLKGALNDENQLAVGLVKYFSHETTLGEGYKKYADWLNALTLTGSNFKEIFKECVIPSPCWMVSKSDLIKCGAFKNNIYPEDYDLCFRMRRARFSIKSVKSVIHHWRDYQNRTSRNDSNYSKNSFIPIKMKYFIEDDYLENYKLVLWGAGKKGKEIAQILSDKNIEFQWVCNNENKIGHHIYSTKIQSPESLSNNFQYQFLIAVAQRNAQEEILANLNSKPNKKIYNFS